MFILQNEFLKKEIKERERKLREFLYIIQQNFWKFWYDL